MQPKEAVGCEHNWRRRTCDSRGFLWPEGEGKLEGLLPKLISSATFSPTTPAPSHPLFSSPSAYRHCRQAHPWSSFHVTLCVVGFFCGKGCVRHTSRAPIVGLDIDHWND